MCFLFLSHIILSRTKQGNNFTGALYVQGTVPGAEPRCHSLAPKAWDPISPGGSVSLQPGKKPGQTNRGCFDLTHLLIAWNQVLIFCKPSPPWVVLEITVIPSLRPLCSIFSQTILFLKMPRNFQHLPNSRSLSGLCPLVAIVCHSTLFILVSYCDCNKLP